MTRGSVGAHLSREARSGAIGYMAAPEPTSASLEHAVGHTVRPGPAGILTWLRLWGLPLGMLGSPRFGLWLPRLVS
jgi:hypothetical protein